MPDIELKKIQPNRLNPRLEFTKAGLDELSDSIKQVGLLQPIIVRPRGDDTYEVVVGERRYRAAQQAGLDRVPVIVRDYRDDEVIELNLIENIQREDLGAVEKGNSCAMLLARFSDKYPTHGSIAQSLGLGRQTVSDWIQVANMPIEIQHLIAPGPEGKPMPKGRIDYRSAMTIARKVKEQDRAIEVAQAIASKGMPHRTAMRIAKEVGRQPEKPIQQVFREVVDEAPIFLPFSKAHADTIVKSVKTQTSRKTKDPKLQPGVIVRAQITHFADLEVTDVYRKKLGEFDEEDAKREGGYTLDEFKEVWKALHGEWNPNETVYVIRFRVARVIGEAEVSS